MDNICKIVENGLKDKIENYRKHGIKNIVAKAVVHANDFKVGNVNAMYEVVVSGEMKDEFDIFEMWIDFTIIDKRITVPYIKFIGSNNFCVRSSMMKSTYGVVFGEVFKESLEDFTNYINLVERDLAFAIIKKRKDVQEQLWEVDNFANELLKIR